MIRNFDTKKDQLLDAALKLVAKKNNFDVTIREIAAEANVNIAAVNYYFKSKQQLFTEMENLFYDNFVDAFMPLKDDSLSKEDKLVAWLQKAISYGVHYPGMLVLLKDKFNRESDSEKDIKMKIELISYICEIRNLFVDVISPPEERCNELFISFLCGTIFPFFGDTYMQGMGIEMAEASQADYLRLIVNKFKK